MIVKDRGIGRYSMSELAIGGCLDIDLGTMVAVKGRDLSLVWVKLEVKYRISGKVWAQHKLDLAMDRCHG